MKKVILFFVVCVTCICAYANTCTYDGVQVTLYDESVSCNDYGAWIYVTTNKTNVSEVRCQISVGGKRVWVNISIQDGKGELNIKDIASLNPGTTYIVKLVAGAGQCY